MKYCLLLLSLWIDSPQAAAFLYQELTADTLPTRYCYPITKAKDLTSDRYNLDRFTKRFCGALGAGWYVDKRKADGTTVCTPCTGAEEGKHQCYMQKVVVSCKMIKPDSMFKLPNPPY